MSAWNGVTPLLTVQNLSFVNGFTSDVPNTSSTARGGGAIFQDGGSLAVINSIFTHNQCASTGQDVSGGAINGQGVGTLTIVGSTFSDNSGSKAAQWARRTKTYNVNTTFANNSATGTDGNPGNGGDGGALSYDGANVSLAFCGDSFTGNRANAAGGAVFRVGYHDEEVDIDRCTFDELGRCEQWQRRRALPRIRDHKHERHDHFEQHRPLRRWHLDGSVRHRKPHQCHYREQHRCRRWRRLVRRRRDRHLAKRHSRGQYRRWALRWRHRGQSAKQHRG